MWMALFNFKLLAYKFGWQHAYKAIEALIKCSLEPMWGPFSSGKHWRTLASTQYGNLLRSPDSTNPKSKAWKHFLYRSFRLILLPLTSSFLGNCISSSQSTRKTDYGGSMSVHAKNRIWWLHVLAIHISYEMQVVAYFTSFYGRVNRWKSYCLTNNPSKICNHIVHSNLCRK